MAETCSEFVRRIWGKCTNKEIEGLLWQCTAFPMASVEHVEQQLQEAKRNSGGDYAVAMKQADDAITEAMKGL